ncbi:MAG TPA: hypothetical protein VFR67_14485 [Pilimelia sp.]|nr:hypothetical protein [Pilimelia sp.]
MQPRSRRTAVLRAALAIGTALVAATVLAGPAAAAPPPFSTTTLVSVGRFGGPANSVSGEPAVSATGRYVAYSSFATNLVAKDTNASQDVFVRDLVTGPTRRVSVGAGGAQGNRGSFTPAISADGRYVAFASDATNLVSGDTNAQTDVFVRDTVAGTTRRVSVGPRNRQANGPSFFPAISADGRYVLFLSAGSNLVSGDTNGFGDVFVRDIVAGTTRRVNVGAGGQANNATLLPDLSGNGRYAVFMSYADNLVSGDTNADVDVFVRDIVAGTTRRVSVGPGGVQGNSTSRSPSISADGRYVAFDSFATNLVSGDTNGAVDVFVRDLVGRTTRLVSIDSAGAPSTGASFAPSISGDGRRVAFLARAALVPGDTNDIGDVYLRDLVEATTTRISVAAGGAEFNLLTDSPAISAYGWHVAFVSAAPDHVPGDTNNAEDVFVRH